MATVKSPKDRRHKRFAEKFVAGLNGEKAYRQAGYNPRNEGDAQKGVARLLARVDVQSWIQHLIQSQQEDSPPELAVQHQSFADDWMTHGNGTQAYYNAGYEPASEEVARVCGSQLLARKDVQAYIRWQQKQRSQRLQITADKVQAEIARIAFSNLFDVVEFKQDKEGGETLCVKQDVPLDAQVAIAKLVHQQTKYGTELEVRMHDKLGALKLLLRFYGMDLNPNELIARLRSYGYEVREPNEVEDGRGKG